MGLGPKKEPLKINFNHKSKSIGAFKEEEKQLSPQIRIFLFFCFLKERNFHYAFNEVNKIESFFDFFCLSLDIYFIEYTKKTIPTFC